MFNKKDASAEIAESMESHLVTHAIEKQAEQLNKFAKALDYLNSVAEIFDELGLRREAEATTTLLEVVAKKKSKKKSKTKAKPVKSKRKSSKPRRSDPATKGLTSEKMEDNLKEKGWVFNADDNDDEDLNLAYDSHHDSCMCMDCMDAEDFAFDDDENDHYDTESDASYHIDRNDADFDKDEREQDFARMFHDFEDEDDVRREFEESNPWGDRPTMREAPVAKRPEFDWESLRPQNRHTLPSTPAAKRHRF